MDRRSTNVARQRQRIVVVERPQQSQGGGERKSRGLLWAIGRSIYVYLFSGLFWILPLRFSFTLLVLLRRANLPGAGWTWIPFRSVTRRRMRKQPDFRFSSILSDWFPSESAELLFQIACFREGTEVMTRSGMSIRSVGASMLMARLLFEIADFDQAKSVLSWWQSPTELVYQKGLLDLLTGDEDRAVLQLISAASETPELMRPHQNLSARASGDYMPTDLDIDAGAQGHLFDAYNYLGQRVTHVGAGHLGAKLYSNALGAQQKLRNAWPELSVELANTLADLGISLDELHLLGPEWVAQIGHLGMLDIFFRMQDLGWWKGRALLLAPRVCANDAMLSLYENRCQIFAASSGLGSPLYDEIGSLQRYCGDNFNAFAMPTGEVVPWQEAGALLMQQWEAEGRGYPLVDEYDSRYGTDEQVLVGIEKAKKRWRIGPQDWYVCLHVRDVSHYGEIKGTGQSHRNAEVRSYIPMIKHIIRQGGWVIKLGGPNSPRFPKMRRFIDYARSPFKSNIMDLHLIRHARYFVGTTSGLTNVAISFGVPCALVNCITVDAQLWGDRVRFAVKPVFGRDGRMLTQRQITSAPGRWQLFGADTLATHGLVAKENTRDEILQTVKEVESLANEIGNRGSERPKARTDAPDPDGLIKSWRHSLGLPHFYGNAQPSRYFLHKYRSKFLED